MEKLSKKARVERKRKNRPEERKHNTGNARSKPSTSHIRDSKGKSELQTTPMKRKKWLEKTLTLILIVALQKRCAPIITMVYIAFCPIRLGFAKTKHFFLQICTGKAYGRHSDGYGSRKSSYSANPGVRFGARTAAYPATRYRGYAYAEASEPRVRPSDLVPHAGYLPALKPATSSYEYD